MSNWYKRAGYSYFEDVQDQILNAMNLLFKCPQQNCKAEYAKLETIYRNLRKGMQTPRDQLNQGFPASQLNKTVLDASKTLSSKTMLDALAVARTNVQQYQQGYQGTFDVGRQSAMYWEHDANLASKVILEPSTSPTEPGRIVLNGLRWPRSPEAQQVVAGMGGALTTDGTNTYVRGTSEAWQKFLSLSHWVFKDQEALAAIPLRLPSEKRFNAEYAKEKTDKFKPQVFEAYLLNSQGAPANRSQETWDVGNKRLEQTKPAGIRLQFDPSDPNLYLIRDLIYKTAGFQKIRVSRQQGVIDVFERDANGWYAITKKLQEMGYQTKGEKLNDLVTALTGTQIGEMQTTQAEVVKSQPIGDDAINNSIMRNRSEHPTVGDRFGVQGQLSKEQFFQLLQQHYSGAFQVPQSQQAAQMEGMYYAATHGVSVLADEPGSGKTAQAIVAADVVRNNGQKILVISPNILVGENWTGPNAKGPMQFCGHSREQVATVKDEGTLEQIMSDPNIIWVIVPRSLLMDKKKGLSLGKAIGRHSQAGKFSSSMIDEIQMVKDDDSNTFEALRNALVPAGVTREGRPYGIKHRMGLSGTPSDNDPGDIYMLYRLLRHPLLYDNSGLRDDGRLDLVLRQNENGFLSQFIGGGEKNPQTGAFEPTIMKGVALSNKIRQGGATKRDAQTLQWSISNVVTQMIGWASKLNDQQKLQILDLFSGTFLRRNKKDIRPDAPGVQQEPMPIQAPEGVQLEDEGKNWHTKSLKRMAEMKIPMTVNLAAQFLQGDQNQKVFILTKHPDIAEKISAQINGMFGEGTCTFVSGKFNKTDEQRKVVADTFRNQNPSNPGYLPQQQRPLRAVVYTMGTGAVGLNFAIATKAIFNDLDWNPSKNEQGIHRINRIDSTETAEIYYPFFEGTYDEEMFHRVERKQKVNSHIANVMRAANQVEGEQRIRVAESYIRELIRSTMYDLELTDQQVQILDSKINGLFMAPAQQVAAMSWWKRTKLSSLRLTERGT